MLKLRTFILNIYSKKKTCSTIRANLTFSRCSLSLSLWARVRACVCVLVPPLSLSLRLPLSPSLSRSLHLCSLVASGPPVAAAAADRPQRSHLAVEGKDCSFRPKVRGSLKFWSRGGGGGGGGGGEEGGGSSLLYVTLPKSLDTILE